MWRKLHIYSAVRGISCAQPGQINEALCKILAHNVCVLIQATHALNIHPIFVQKPKLHKKCRLKGFYVQGPDALVKSRLNMGIAVATLVPGC